MDFVSLGNTGLKVSRICLGCMSYGTSKWRDWVLDEDASFPFYGQALDAGINFFDTADIYSNGVSEEVTGRALRKFGVRREEVVIATKVLPDALAKACPAVGTVSCVRCCPTRAVQAVGLTTNLILSFPP